MLSSKLSAQYGPRGSVNMHRVQKPGLRRKHFCVQDSLEPRRTTPRTVHVPDNAHLRPPNVVNPSLRWTSTPVSSTRACEGNFELQ